jgi:hypothetical protein
MKNLLFLLALLGVCSAQTPTDPVRQVTGADEAPAKMRWGEREFMMPVPGAPQGIHVLQVEAERPGKHPLGDTLGLSATGDLVCAAGLCSAGGGAQRVWTIER